jgi:hypothetical protein
MLLSSNKHEFGQPTIARFHMKLGPIARKVWVGVIGGGLHE